MSGYSDNMKGAIYMMAAMAGYVLNDVMIKLVSNDLELWQAVFLRGIVATTLLGLIACKSGAFSYRPAKRDIGIIWWRTVAEIGATYCFLLALFNMPLANATAIMQSLPLAVTLAASVFLRQKVGWRRYSAITLGFLGVLIIVRPGTEGFNAYSLYVLGAVAFVTLRDLLAYKLSPETPSLFVAFFTAAAIMICAGLVTSTQEWNAVSPQTAIYLSGAAVFILVGYIAAVTAMRHGDIAFVSPFRYSVMVWALLLGYLVFADIPDLWTLLGTAIIVGMGIFTIHRERKARG